LWKKFIIYFIHWNNSGHLKSHTVQAITDRTGYYKEDGNKYTNEPETTLKRL